MSIIDDLYVKKDKVNCDDLMIFNDKPCDKRILNNSYEATDGYVQVVMSYVMPNNLSKKEKIHLAVISTILSGNESSRLYERFRIKEQLVYFIMSMVQSFKYENMLLINFICKSSYIQTIVNLVEQELGLFKIGDITDEEIEGSKKLIKNIILKTTEDIKNMLCFIGKSLTYKEVGSTLADTIKIIDDICKEDIVSFCKNKISTEYVKIIVNKG